MLIILSHFRSFLNISRPQSSVCIEKTSFLEITNPIDLGEWMPDKDTTMDIKAKTDSGELLTIEMQVDKLTYYRNRALFYGGRLVNSSLKSGEPYDKTKNRAPFMRPP